MIRSPLITLFVGCLSSFLIATTQIPTARADTVIAEQVVARVNGRPILLSEVRRQARPHLRRLTGSALSGVSETQTIYAQILDQRIEEEIVASMAAPLHITISDADVDAGLASIAKENKVTREDLLHSTMMQGMTVTELRSAIRGQLLRQRVIFMLGTRDKLIAGAYPSDTAEQIAWFARVEKAFTAEKRRACVERFVRW